MTRIEIGKFLVADSRVCSGRLVFKGSRVPVSDALELAQAGHSPEEIAKQYRNVIKPEAVREALSLIRRGIVREVFTKAKTAA